MLPLLVLSGALIAAAPVYGAALVVGLTGLLIAFFVPLGPLLVATLVISTLVTGSLEYFLGISQANWFPFIVSAIVAVRVALAHAFRQRSPGRRGEAARIPWFVVPAVLYLLALLGSALINQSPLLQVLASVKNYLMMWGILLGFLATGRPLLVDVRQVFTAICIVVMMQLPVVAYQKFFIASRIGNTASSLSFDAINGTFGGGLLGGNSGGLIMFVCVALAYVLILWREKRIGGLKLLGFCILALPNLFMVEVKAVLVWLPVVVLWVFAGQIRSRPHVFFLGAVGALGAVAAVLWTYVSTYYAAGSTRDLWTFIDQNFAYIYDPDRFNPLSRELGRISALVHWWREVDLSNPLEFVLGFGPGASRSVSSLAVGEVARRYPFIIDSNALVVLLWDVGVMGTVAFVGLLLLALFECMALARQAALPKDLRIFLESGAISLVLILSTLIYTRAAVDGAITQFLLFFCLALVARTRREYGQQGRRRAAVPVARAATA